MEACAEDTSDWLGTQRSDLIAHLPWEAAKGLIVDGTGDANAWTELARDEASIRAEMLDYMPFAWKKANDRRSLSAERSLEHMSAWLWLIGRDKAAAQISKHDQYGKPQLRAICEAFGWDWQQWDDGLWSEDEMEDGEPAPRTRIKLMEDECAGSPAGSDIHVQADGRCTQPHEDQSG